jgi:hypothetical protein
MELAPLSRVWPTQTAHYSWRLSAAEGGAVNTLRVTANFACQCNPHAYRYTVSLVMCLTVYFPLPNLKFPLHPDLCMRSLITGRP